MNRQFATPLYTHLSIRLRDQLSRLTKMKGTRSTVSFGLPFLLYVLTLAPSIYNLDSAELTTAAYTGGLMRATGYPLYLTLGYFWSRLPLGDAGYRMNLLSAVFAALTILLADRTLRRLHVDRWAAFGALGLLATSTFFWGLSLVAEVYTLHTALMAGLILALLRWGEAPSPQRMAWIALFTGLGFAHHAAMVLLFPGAIFYLLATHAKRLFEPRSILAAIIGLLVGMSFILYLPLRYLARPEFNYAGVFDAGLQFQAVDLTTLEGLWWLISGKAFAGAMLAYSGTELLAQAGHFLVQLGQAFVVIGLGPGILGAVVLFRRNWRIAGMLALMFGFNAGFYINYQVMDKETMFLPAYLIWAIWLGVGYSWAVKWLSQVTPTIVRQASQLALHTLLVGGVLFALVWNWQIVDLSKDWTTRQRGETILQRVEPGALVFGWWDTVPVLSYLQLVEGQRPDVQVVNRFLIAPLDLEQAIREEVTVRPVYIDSVPENLSTILLAKPVGPVYQLVYPSESGRRSDP